MEEPPRSAGELYRRLVVSRLRSKLGTIFAAFAVAAAALSFYEHHVASGLFILAVAVFHFAHAPAGIGILVGSMLRRRRGVTR